MAAVLLVAAALRLWRLDDNGFGAAYYAAGVRSMLQGAWLFFYNAFDPAGFISLDKPPVAFWIQTAFARLLGFSGWTIHLPQALAGIASVALLYRLVRRPFGVAAGLCAALLMAVMPIAVAVDRSNNTDSWLVFFLLLAAPVIVRTGLPVMAFGGFFGNDPVMSVEGFAKRVESGEVRFVVLATNRRTRDFERWVQLHGVAVDPAEWRSLPTEPRRSIALYDVAPR